MINSSMFQNNAVKQISSGLHHNAVVCVSGKLFTFGLGSNGRLGHFSEENQPEPRMVEALQNSHIIQVMCGNDCTGCIDSERQLWVFGFNNRGKLGIFSLDSKISEPVCLIPIPNDFNIEGVSEVSFGFTHTTIQTTDEKIFLLGDIKVNLKKDTKRSNYMFQRLEGITVFVITITCIGLLFLFNL